MSDVKFEPAGRYPQEGWDIVRLHKGQSIANISPTIARSIFVISSFPDALTVTVSISVVSPCGV